MFYGSEFRLFYMGEEPDYGEQIKVLYSDGRECCSQPTEFDQPESLAFSMMPPN